MRLISLRLLNFKGIRDFTFTPDGQDADIKGDNGTGKTSLKDAYLWILTGKDSENKTDFAIKTLDANNVPLPGLNHEVEAVLDINGRKVTLKKAYCEKWTKKRGSVKSELTGHTTNHFIDGVPKSEKEYLAFIASIAPEETFKVLTNPSYFSKMPDSPKLPGWKKRRQVLLEFCGDLSDAEVIASDSKLAKLPDILPEGRTLDEHKKVIASRRSEINEEIGKIPVRIDEANRALPDISGIDAKGLPAAIEAAKGILGKKQDELARIQGGGEIAEKRRQLAVIEGDILRLQNDHQTEQNKAIQAKYALMSEAKGRVTDAAAEQARAKRRMDAIAVELEKLEANRKQLREDWRKISDEQFEYFGETACPTCGQDLPEEKVEGAREKALKAFNLDKAKRLENINSTGRGIKANIETLNAENSDLVARANAAELKLQENEAETVTLQVEIDALRDQTKPITDNPEYTNKQSEKENIEAVIAQLQANSETAANAVLAEIADIRRDIESLEMDLLKVKSRATGERRIEELKAQEKILAAEFEKLEGELYLCETFVKTKVSLLESRINSKFKYARFKMFEVQINGGITECCEVLYGGVPYSSGLNAGHRIIVGMDIIRSLSEYYGFEAPIFVDNAESVSVLPEMSAQVIRLVKPDMEPPKPEGMSDAEYLRFCEQLRQKYSKLVVETENKEYKEAV